MPLVHAASPTFVYYVPPKTASTTVIRALQKLYEDAEVLYDKHGIFAPPGWSDYFHFITVRNPFSRAVSLWQFFAQDSTFQEFLRSTTLQRFRNKLWHAMPASWWHDRMPRCDAILRMETLREDLRALSFVPDSYSVGHRNKTGRSSNANGVIVHRDRPWHAYYTYDDDEIVRELYAEDFARYGYSTDLQSCVP